MRCSLSVSMAIGAEQLGEFARRGAAQQVHLEVALLRVHVAERAHGIGSLAASMVTTPSASRSTVTGADRPGRDSSPSSVGRLPRSSHQTVESDRQQQQQQGQQAAFDPFRHVFPPSRELSRVAVGAAVIG